MSNSRLLSSFTLDATNNTIVLSVGGGADTPVTLTAGTYYWSSDGETDDFLLELDAQLTSEFGDVWTVEIAGVEGSHSGYADGRIYVLSTSSEFEWVADDAGWTLDPRILGIDPDAANPSSVNFSWYSTWVHRYGWYPQQDALEHTIYPIAVTNVQFSSARALDGIDDGEHDTLTIAYDRVHSALCTTYDASLANAADMNLTVGDENCSFVRWALDLARDTSRRWRYYEDQTSATYIGPLVFGVNSVLWSDPLGGSILTERAGNRRDIPVDGIESA